MKKVFSVLLALTLALSLCACQQSASQSPSPEPTVSDEPSASAEPSPTTEVGEVTFTRDNIPRLDGSTSTAPLARAVAAVLLGESEDEVSDLVQFSRTTASFRALMAGDTDLLIVSEPNASVYDEMREAGFEVSMDAFATDALVFVVNAENPVDSLTWDQLQGIYSGRITNWSEVGGDDQEIIPFQRNEDAGSQALMNKLVMTDEDLMDAPTNYVVDSMMGLMEAVRSYDNSPGAIGYSVYYYAHDMEMAQGLKLISVDGVAPSADSIRSGAYPFCNAYYVVMAADTPEDSMTSILYHWILSEDGQRLADQQGYVSVMEVE
jgi:phosphate transport system substrate-binding protein